MNTETRGRKKDPKTIAFLDILESLEVGQQMVWKAKPMNVRNMIRDHMGEDKRFTVKFIVDKCHIFRIE